jgi:hypothetical protein
MLVGLTGMAYCLAAVGIALRQCDSHRQQALVREALGQAEKAERCRATQTCK